MRLLTKIGRRLATFAVVGMLAAIATATPASAAVTYWKFKNIETQQCLTSGVKGGPDDHPTAKVFLRSCVVSDYQDWDWVGNDLYKLLQNRKTKLCLMTDDKGGDDAKNGVWTSRCDGTKPGQRWAWYAEKWLQAEITGFLRSDPKPGAVYVHDNYFNDRSDWYGNRL